MDIIIYLRSERQYRKTVASCWCQGLFTTRFCRVFHGSQINAFRFDQVIHEAFFGYPVLSRKEVGLRGHIRVSSSRTTNASRNEIDTIDRVEDRNNMKRRRPQDETPTPTRVRGFRRGQYFRRRGRNEANGDELANPTRRIVWRFCSYIVQIQCHRTPGMGIKIINFLIKC